MHLTGRQELLVTLQRSFNGAHAYSHSIRWAPGLGTRIVLQHIVRTSKILTTTRWGTRKQLDGPRGNYWELWEVFGGDIYPFNMGAGTGAYIPDGHLTRPQARTHLRFHIPAGATYATPFLTAAAGVVPGPVATDRQIETGIHDVYTIPFKARHRCTFKIHGEIYELSLEQCIRHRDWLNRFTPYNVGDGAHTAGMLPALFEPAAPADLQRPTLLRYEAGSFDATHHLPGHYRAVERVFPRGATGVRFNPSGPPVNR